MKKPFSFIYLLFFTFGIAKSQSTLVLKPGTAEGKDASICNAFTWSSLPPPNVQNYGDHFALRNNSWTAYIHNSALHDWWSLLEFEALDTFLLEFEALNALQQLDILSATLKLFELPDNPYFNGGQYGNNQTKLFRITKHWEEMEVTWENRPTYDDSQSIIIPANNDFDSVMVDVTDWVRYFIETPENNHGFLIRPTLMDPYRSMNFSSSDHEDQRYWPELIIEYETSEKENCQFDFPNVFTPDGNGINDRFGVVTNCMDNIRVSMQIYDRWGKQVFQSNNAIDGWDGKIKGQAALPDVYIFRAVVKVGQEEEFFEGNFTLMK